MRAKILEYLEQCSSHIVGFSAGKTSVEAQGSEKMLHLNFHRYYTAQKDGPKPGKVEK